MHRLRDGAAALHSRPWPSPPSPSVWVLDVDRPALVLGSTQPHVAAANIDVVRRRSGGGAVLVEPGSLLWVDVMVPAGDRLWHVDVGRAFLWLGDVWVAALAAVGVGGASRHDGPLLRSSLADVACFAGLGPGEVSLTRGRRRKVVGISQRRTRHAALFQCAALLAWDGAALARLLGMPEATAELSACAAALPVERPALERAFLDAIAAV